MSLPWQSKSLKNPLLCGNNDYFMFRKKSIVPPEYDEEQPSEDPMIFCFVCGHLRPSKTLIEHIDKCYRRVEAETSLTSIFETKVEGSKRLFCDAYNNNTKAFCKRLKVNHKLKFFDNYSCNGKYCVKTETKPDLFIIGDVC